MAETMRKVEKGCRKLEEDAPPTLTAPIKVKVAELDQLFKDLREMCRLDPVDILERHLTQHNFWQQIVRSLFGQYHFRVI